MLTLKICSEHCPTSLMLSLKDWWCSAGEMTTMSMRTDGCWGSGGLMVSSTTGRLTCDILTTCSTIWKGVHTLGVCLFIVIFTQMLFDETDDWHDIRLERMCYYYFIVYAPCPVSVQPFSHSILSQSYSVWKFCSFLFFHFFPSFLFCVLHKQLLFVY